jgi:hypothetical protein
MVRISRAAEMTRAQHRAAREMRADPAQGARRCIQFDRSRKP